MTPTEQWNNRHADPRHPHRCTNTEPAHYGHECGRPAQWQAAHREGFKAHFCDECKRTGYEARQFSQWTPAQESPRHA